MSSSPVYILKLLGSGVLEKSVLDIFSEDYVKTFYSHPGRYKVQCRNFKDGYTTLHTVRYVEIEPGTRIYNAPEDEPSVEDTHVVGSEPPVVASQTSIDVSPAEFKMVQAPGGNYNIVDQKGNVIYGGFNLTDLQKAKEAVGEKGPITDKDMTNKRMMEYLVVFVAGAAFGGLAIFMYLDGKYKKEMNKMSEELMTVKATLDEVQAKQKTRRGVSLMDYNDFDPIRDK